MRRALISFVFLYAVMLPAPAPATPDFARRTMLSCNACHTVGTKLTEFGKAFMVQSYRVPRLTGVGNAPVAVRGQMVYSSEPDPTGLPKAIVDEVDFLSAGPLGKHFNYNIEQYSLDGGRDGLTRETWIEYLTSQKQRLPLQIRAGLQVLPIPVDPERFRETNAHYALYDQTVGSNPFTFFDPHMALSIGVGHEIGGIHAAFLAVDPHDPQSTLPRSGLDRMLALTHADPSLALEAYRYDGKRVIAGANDDFWRQGYGASMYRGRFALTAVVQTGYDANADGAGTAISSSGGFLQARMQVGAHNFAIARYDGTNDTTGNFGRSLTFGGGTLLGRAFRLEIEDQVFHAPQTHNALSIVLGFGMSTVHEGSFAY